MNKLKKEEKNRIVQAPQKTNGGRPAYLALYQIPSHCGGMGIYYIGMEGSGAPKIFS
jgi:hypothetical protein